MNVSAAYIAVVLIWSTTPLGIVWSSETMHPTLAVLLRMLIALVLGSILLKVYRVRFPVNKQAIKLYCFSGFGVFGGMLFSYLSARYISSGLMSLIFGLSPILSSVMAQKLINEPKFNGAKKLALIIATIGLLIVCYDNILLGNSGYIGIVFIMLGVFFFSLSSVLTKSVVIAIHPLATTVGALFFCTPLFLIIWLLADGSLNYQQWQTRSVYSIIYLGVFGSLIGFIAYFYVLQKLKASTVALITMITPVIAMTLGVVLNDETLSVNLIIGAIFVVFGLSCFQWSDKVSSTISQHSKRKLNIKS